MNKAPKFCDMKYLLVFITGLVAAPNCCIGMVETKFTMQDLSVVGDLTENLNTKCVVLVQDGEDVGMMRSIRRFSERYVYHTVLNASSLRGILARNVTQLNFFQRKTAIVTNERQELSIWLKEVSAPLFVTWIVLRDYSFYPKLHIPVSNQVIFVNSTSGRPSVARVYHLRPETKPIVKPFDVASSVPFREDLEKMNFQNVTMDMLVLNKKETCSGMNTTFRKLECAHQDVLESMAVRLNFSINVVECLEKENPFTYPNGSDSELFLKLMNREVDFSAIGHVIIRNDKRKEFLEYAWPTFDLKSRIYIRQGRLSGRWLTYLRPLESSVWWGILVWVVTTGILLLIFEKLLRNGLKFNVSFIVELINSTLKALQVFCNQAVLDIPSSYSIRMIYFLKFFVVLIFFQAYCGYLVSSITVAVSHFPFRDLKGFFENQQYKMMTLRRGFHHYYIRKVLKEEHKETFMLPRHHLPDTIQQAIDKLCKRKYLAFNEFREDLLNFKRLNCKIWELPTPAACLYVGIAMPNKSPLKEFFKRELLHLKSAGLLRRLGAQLSSRSDFREKFTQNEFKTVSMRQIFSIFIFLGLSVMLSLTILIVELILERSKSSSSRGVNKKLQICEKFHRIPNTLSTTGLYKRKWLALDCQCQRKGV